MAKDYNTALMEDANNYTLKIDAVDANTTYIGKADHGLSSSKVGWQIKKIHTISTVTTISFADGVDSFSKIWDDRLSYSY